MPGFAPRVAIILGSGLGGLADSITDVTEFPYETLPGFPVSTVEGHAGKMVCGKLEGEDVVCLKGRVHLYEGIDPRKVRIAIYTFKELGCDIMFSTSAVGSLLREVGPGGLLLLKDHMNFQGMNPLIGANDPIGPRFPSMLNAYDPHLRSVIQEKAQELGMDKLVEGVFTATSGPSFETPAEVEAYRILGGGCVGMSMVPEVICARHCGLRVAAIAVVVNYAAGMTDEHITHEETLHFGAIAGAKVEKICKAFVTAKDQW